MRSLCCAPLNRCVLGLLLLTWVWGCQSTETTLDDVQVGQYEKRMVEEEPFDLAPDMPLMEAPPPVDLAGQVATRKLSLDGVLWLALPDPARMDEVLDRRLDVGRWSESVRREYEKIFGHTRKYVRQIEQPAQFRLSLADALRRTLAYNYDIKVDGFAPAISTAQVVQAEAAFDTAFFANISRNNTDQPTPSQLAASQTDTTVVSGGIRKLLATGAAVTLTETMVRVDNPGFAFQTLNPSWQHAFQAELRQPILRNFGIDFNRAQINIRKLERQSNEQAFRAQVIEVLNNTEQAYWSLVAARRDVVISAELLAHAVHT